MPHTIELLAPARDLATGRAALRAGADAVYIGGPDFGARAAAGNTVEKIAALVQEAHLFKARVYVTLNTLLTDAELHAAEKLAWQLAEVGVDALIVQDVRLLQLHLPPTLELHASTQMDNRTPQQAQLLERAGFRQIVVARELSLDEIRAIHEAVPTTPLEAFVHGALCVSLSGRCYASEFCFNRSANRGRCAQFCRLAFNLINLHTGETLRRQQHLLSLRDMNRTAFLEQMLDAGVRSFKIEGRLKGADYVANLTAWYRQALDEILQRRSAEFVRASVGTSRLQFTPAPERSFSRGFTPYFIEGHRTEMLSPFTPKSLGTEIGVVRRIASQRCFEIQPREGFTLHAGDGLCFLAPTPEGALLQGFRVNRVEGSRIFTASALPRALVAGTRLMRNEDYQFSRLLEREDAAVRTLWIDICFAETPTGFSLRLTDEAGRRIERRFEAEKQPARTPQGENLRRALTKLGGTPYTLRHFEATTSQDYFLSAATLNAWRREAITALLASESDTKKNENCSEKRETCSDEIFTALRESTSQGLSALPRALMTCRFCLRHALGQCIKDAPQGTPHAPWALRLPDGRTFPLHFDCKRCQMLVYAPQ